MKTNLQRTAPLAQPGLIVRDIDDESVVYDFSNHRAHCLNDLARRVLRRCDGQTDVATIATLLGDELGTPIPEDLVWVALDELGRAKLLATPVVGRVDLGRRRALKKLAISFAVPAVWSLVAPSTAYAASTVSCIPPASCMGSSLSTCCGSSGSLAMSCSGAGLCTGTGSSCTQPCK